MPIKVKMPNLSQTTDEVKLLRWLVKEGEKVKKGDILCEVETDKVNMEVESFTDGMVLKLIGEPENQIKAGSVIAVIGKEGEELTEKPDVDIKTSEEKKELKNDLNVDKYKRIKKSPPKVRATKLVQSLAAKKSVDLSEVKGTGPRKTITKKDLEDYIESKKKGIVESQKIIDKNQKYYNLTPNQQAVSSNLVKSKENIPHYYLKAEIFADNLIKKRINDKKAGRIISMYSYFVFYSAKALERFPKLNGYFKDSRIYKNSQINVGFAVASEDELYVPVIKEANSKNLYKIDEEVKWLVSKAQNKKLEPEDISGGTFTISNLGIYPIDEFYGIINYPQAVLLATGRIKKTLSITDDNNMTVRNVFSITGSFDHRIANGALAASFLTEMKKLLEEE